MRHLWMQCTRWMARVHCSEIEVCYELCWLCDASCTACTIAVLPPLLLHMLYNVHALSKMHSSPYAAHAMHTKLHTVLSENFSLYTRMHTHYILIIFTFFCATIRYPLFPCRWVGSNGLSGAVPASYASLTNLVYVCVDLPYVIFEPSACLTPDALFIVSESFIDEPTISLDKPVQRCDLLHSVF